MTAWWTDPVQLRAAIETYGSATAAARALGGVTDRTVQRQWKLLQNGMELRPDRSGAARARRSGPSKDADSAPPSIQARRSTPNEVAEPPGFSITETTATLVSTANPQGTADITPEDLLRSKGLDPSEWDYRVTVNQWDVLTGHDPDTGEPGVATMSQLKVVATKRPDSLVRIELPKRWKPRVPRGNTSSSLVQLVPLFADPHFPLHEPDVVDGSLAWLREFSPSRIVCLGDEGDWSPFKRHRANRRTDTTVERAVLGTFSGLAAWRHAAPDAIIDLIPGNHTAWLEQRVLEMFPTLMGAIPPGEEEPLVSMRRLLKLDELHINWHGTTGEYHDATLELAPGLVLMHGTRTGKGGGAVKEQERWEQTSVVQGHDHTLALTAINKRLPGGGWTQRYAVSAGAMSRRDLGYDPAHNVGQGWPVVTIWPDGRWHVDFALYDPVTRSVTWRDWRYDA